MSIADQSEEKLHFITSQLRLSKRKIVCIFILLYIFTYIAGIARATKIQKKKKKQIIQTQCEYNGVLFKRGRQKFSSIFRTDACVNITNTADQYSSSKIFCAHKRTLDSYTLTLSCVSRTDSQNHTYSPQHSAVWYSINNMQGSCGEHKHIHISHSECCFYPFASR